MERRLSALIWGRKNKEPVDYAVEPEVPKGSVMVKAGWWQRFFAYLIDGIILSIIMALVICSLAWIFGHGFQVAWPGSKNDPFGFPLPWGEIKHDNNFAKSTVAFWQFAFVLLSLLVFAVYQLISQIKRRPARRGQTPGKSITGVRVVRQDGSAVGVREVLLREVLGKGIVYFLLAFIVAGVLRDTGYPNTANSITGTYFFLWWVIIPVWATNALCPHDWIGKTRVVVDIYKPPAEDVDEQDQVEPESSPTEPDSSSDPEN